MKNCNKLKALVALIVFMLSFQTYSYAEEIDSGTDSEVPESGRETIYLRTEEDLLCLSDNCKYDTWSKNKDVILENDISLSGINYTPVQSFSGSFEGNGHTISGISLQGAMTNAGFIAVVENGGTVKNLNICATMDMASSCETVGGIAGKNLGSIVNCSFTGSIEGTKHVGGIAGMNGTAGRIVNCRSNGAVFGVTETGGIAGENKGIISACTNAAYVNTASEDRDISLGTVNFDFSLDIEQLTGSNSGTYVSDTGGIAGYSSGIIRSCVNNSVVGYQHVGYNIGGIAGRSCGYISSCSNTGTVYGRKDVSGIVGQMEPYIVADLSESTLGTLQTQLNELSDLVNKAADDAQGGAGGVSSRLNSMQRYVSNAVNELGNIRVGGDVSTSVTRGDGSVTVSGSVGDNSGSVTVTPSTGGEGGITVEPDSGTVSANFGNIEISASPDLSGVTSAVNAIGGQLSALNGAVAGTVGTVADDVRAINVKFNELSNTLFDAVFTMNTSAGDIITDTSAIDIELVTFGKVYSCTNTGNIYGDINVGGVAGTMALDSSLDPEGDITTELSAQYSREYEVKAIIQKCANTGRVTAKRSYSGGVCGRMELGLITNSTNTGDVASETGDYVGGIAGSTAATIRNCFSCETLSGGKYVGGIVGSGTTESLTGACSTVSGCYSMVEINACTQYAGAVSGANAGEFAENYFVSEALCGIDGVSYSGRAEPISYQSLTAVDGLPASMKKLTLSFVADGVTVKQLNFNFGDSFGTDTFPDIPQKADCYAAWDRSELNNLRFNTVVSAQYYPYTTAVASTATRGNGQAAFLALGEFDASAVFEAVTETQSVAEFAPLSAGINTAIRRYLDTRPVHSFAQASINRDVVEQWLLSIPEDGNENHIVRYTGINGSTENLDIYYRTESGWQLLPTEEFGNSLQFEIPGEEAEIAVVSVLPVVWLWLAAAGILLLLVLAFVLFILRIRTKHRRKGMAGAGGTEINVAGKEQGRKRRHPQAWAILLMVCFMLFAVICGVVIRYLNVFGDSIVPYTIIRELSQRSNLSMQLQINTTIGESSSALTAQVETSTCGGKKITSLTFGNASVYYSNGALILENGKVYRLTDSLPDYSDILSTIVPLYKDGDITFMRAGETENYSIALDETAAAALLKKLVPEVCMEAGSTERAEIVMNTQSGEVTGITAVINGKLADGNSSPFSLQMAMDNFGAGGAEIPETVTAAAGKGLTGSEPVVTEDIIRVVLAFSDIHNKDYLHTDISIKANCGPLIVNDRLAVDTETVDGLRVWNVSKGALSIYGTGTTAVTPDGNATGEDNAGLAGAQLLQEALYTVCLDGDISAKEANGLYEYTVCLDGDTVEKLVTMIVPDIKLMEVTYGYGTLTLSVRNNQLLSAQVSGAGNVKVVLAEAPVSVTTGLDFSDGDSFTVPEKVLLALMGTA